MEPAHWIPTTMILRFSTKINEIDSWKTVDVSTIEQHFRLENEPPCPVIPSTLPCISPELITVTNSYKSLLYSIIYNVTIWPMGMSLLFSDENHLGEINWGWSSSQRSSPVAVQGIHSLKLSTNDQSLCCFLYSRRTFCCLSFLLRTQNHKEARAGSQNQK